MSKKDKKIQKMRNNPKNWRIEEIQSIADGLGIIWYHDGSSHVIFQSPTGAHQSIPANRPIKPIYIRKFLELVDVVMEGKDETA